MEKIVIRKEYKGNTVTILKDGKSLYSDKVEKDYLNDDYRIISDSEYQKIHEKYLNSLCGKWEEIEEETYYEMLNILPPLKHSNGGFFISEMYTSDVGNYYKKLKVDDTIRHYTSRQRLSYHLEDITASLIEYVVANTKDTNSYTIHKAPDTSHVFTFFGYKNGQQHTDSHDDLCDLIEEYPEFKDAKIIDKTKNIIKTDDAMVVLDLEDTNISDTELTIVKSLIINILENDKANDDFIINKDIPGLRMRINDSIDYMNRENVISRKVAENIGYKISIL